MKRRHPYLASAQAYWRLAAKADRAGNYALGKQYRHTGDMKYRQYQRQQGARQR